MDTAKIEAAFNDYRDSVYGWAYRLLGNHHDAMDVTQEVFVKWWRAHREQEAPKNAIGWLRRVTINQSINTGRAQSRRPDPGRLRSAVGESAVKATQRSELTTLITLVLAELSERQRDVLVAKVYDGCRFADIARQLELSVPTVKTHYLRALQSARQKLKSAGVFSGESDAM